jgi:hypothetical protein
MAQDETLTVRLVVEEGEVAALEQELAAEGGALVQGPTSWEPPADELGLYGDQQFEPLMVIAIGATLAVLVKRISDVWMRHTRPGGQIVDLRDRPATVRIAPGLDHGELLVIRADGRESFYAKNTDEAAALLKSVLANV